MKKIISLLLVLCMLACILPAAFADYDLDTKTLMFGDDGQFKVLVINDTQDDADTDPNTLELLRRAIDHEQPDLVVLNGDQLSDVDLQLGSSSYVKTLENILDIINEKETPFLFTYGNHDNDKSLVFPISKQAQVYYSYPYCFAEKNGPDSGTYNKLIMGKDGETPVLNIYMMNTGAWDMEGWLSGITPSQLCWYVNKSNELKANNGDKPMPSILFQHIPVKETYDVLKLVDPRFVTEAVRGNFIGTAYKGYVLDPATLWNGSNEEDQDIGEDAVLSSTICSEHPLKYTGQYDAWVKQGDIIGAFFAHDHKNNFVAKSADGIVMGYNRGFGFGTEGDGGKRGGRVFVFTEDEIMEGNKTGEYNYKFYNITFNDLCKDLTFEETEGGIGFILNNLIQMIRATIGNAFLNVVRCRMLG